MDGWPIVQVRGKGLFVAIRKGEMQGWCSSRLLTTTRHIGRGHVVPRGVEGWPIYVLIWKK